MEESSIGNKIDEIHTLRERIRTLEAQKDELKKQKDELEINLMDQMLGQGITKASGSEATVSIAETVVPSVQDWDSFYRYIHRNKSYYLLERRAASVAFRDEIATRNGKPIPGVIPFTKRSVNLRTI